MNYEECKAVICAEIEKYRGALTALSDDLADHPEVSGQEFETARKLVELLRGYGYAVEAPYANLPTAFRAVYGGGNHRYKIAVLVEYDALPQIGHACGHCLSGAVSLLAALALRELQEVLNADIYLVGTPAEEKDGAKCGMAEQGFFDGYDLAMMVHLYDANLVTPKLQCLACYEYTFHGKAAHASKAPWEGVNALNAVQLMCHAIDMQRQHVKPDAQFHGVVRNGGGEPNIVPETASVEFFIRALDKDHLRELIQKADRCAEGAAIAAGVSSWEKKTTSHVYDNLKAVPTGTAALTEVYKELGLPLNGDPNGIFASSDIGNVSFVCPALQPCLQAVNEGVALHTREFAEAMKTDRAHQSLVTGAQIIAYTVAKIFGDEKRIQSLKADFSA